jgi:hypothetical protein
MMFSLTSALEFFLTLASGIIGVVGVLLGVSQIIGLRTPPASPHAGTRLTPEQRARLLSEMTTRRHRSERLSAAELRALRAVLEHLGPESIRPTMSLIVGPSSTAQVVPVEEPVLQEPIRLSGSTENRAEFAS